MTIDTPRIQAVLDALRARLAGTLYTTPGNEQTLPVRAFAGILMEVPGGTVMADFDEAGLVVCGRNERGVRQWRIRYADDAPADSIATAIAAAAIEGV